MRFDFPLPVVNINLARDMNEFAMHDAAENGDLERVRQLIEAGVPVDSLDEEGQSPLHRAAKFGRYEEAALLIDSKCNINLTDRYGHTPVMLATSWDKKDIVDLLLHRGAQVSGADDHGRTLLHWASLHDGWTDILNLILNNGEADLNAVDKDGFTPLMYAGKKFSEEISALLIRRSPPPEVAALLDRRSPPPEVAALIRAGADVNRSDAYYKRTALHWAAQNDYARVIQILLETEGLDLSSQDVNGDTPLHLACQMYRRKVVEQLLNAGTDTNVENNRGETALNIGIRIGYLAYEEINLFVEKGAFLKNCDYECLSQIFFFQETVLKDVELCTQSVVNKFNYQSLPALNRITYFARRLPNVDNFKLRARDIDEVENLVKCEIERNTFCNVVKVHPISLSSLCVLSLITFQSGKKRAASPDFGHSPF